MNKIHVLDCTLRDGGYCNEWKFGHENSKKITSGLTEAGIEIIECGFITEKVSFDPEITRFSSVTDASSIVPCDRGQTIFVAMMNYGEYDIEKLPRRDDDSIDGIRVAFHKKDRYDAIKLCEQIKEKGYLVFVQPMVSLNYTDEEFLEMIRLINELKPYAFYIVDSFGMMKGKDLTRLFFMVEHNLIEDVWIGFHSHNNLQLAYSNAQRLTTVQTSRNLIIDSSIMGMGRGAGNLNTELFVDYLNENCGKKYDISPLLSIADNILSIFYERNFWGYSLPNYISATHNAHPNYAGYLDAKKTLNFEDMNNIFSLMDEEKKAIYDVEYIEGLYLKYQEKETVKEAHLSDFCTKLYGKKVLIIAPGQSTSIERETIISYARRDDVVSISINYDFDSSLTDYIFVSNIRRYRELDEKKRSKCIVTSNISAVDVYLQIKYKDLLNAEWAVKDNAGLMLIKFLIRMGVKDVLIAGMDGYSSDESENYAVNKLQKKIEHDMVINLNAGLNKVLHDYSQAISITFITTPKYVNV